MHVTGKLKTYSLSRHFKVEVSHLAMAKKVCLFCEGMIRKSMEHTFENVYYVNG